jgi:hypothetical protein
MKLTVVTISDKRDEYPGNDVSVSWDDGMLIVKRKPQITITQELLAAEYRETPAHRRPKVGDVVTGEQVEAVYAAGQWSQVLFDRSDA